jgi:hypothetical protein
LSLRGRLVRGNPGFGIVGSPKGRRGGITTLWTGLPRAKRPRNDGGGRGNYNTVDWIPIYSKFDG